ncbi:LuxR family transcriptional regulator [Agrobacterium vitis]|uniref:LuxR family transcriptional regulator n=1 Tax=Agrobacterium vitis TaxID=373 RepID=A0AAE2RHP6_AGRVI|nr:LuxR family transcriptional regulator [Agrobacterium vitis]MCF1500344.1 LuxR family transcriptional regulator [Allorhizobium sp. Av2]MBF2716831.1 LuxR family transcriptional regulator [Agrobacterium vitis]MCM2442637.1 LuxR family transcriptional regulator [Agrobacterium vitis]MUZ60403.1 LuxR family transcriptional regulator [Agrobacterium vitis]MUZ64057.1 LuxR family transcriptional regulator [Agrobacterium vitis]
MRIDHDQSLFEKTFNQIKLSRNTSLAVLILRDNYSALAHVTYHHAHTVLGKMTVDAPFVKTTYPDAWIGRYIIQGYAAIDPVVQEGTKRMLPFRWAEIEVKPESSALFTEFEAHGLGGTGYSIPIIDRAGRRALLSLNFSPDFTEWEEYVNLYQSEWSELAHLIHKQAIEEMYGDKDPAPQISPRELETLYWVGQGKEAAGIAVILGISEHTVRTYMRSARSKLDCATLAQAVAKAMTLRLIKG